jgi:ankyrin repeat protein
MPFNKHQLVIFAARSGNIAALRERVRAGGDINHFDPKHGAPLMAAIRGGNVGIIKWLLANGADVNAEYGTQIGPLEVALYRPDPGVVSLLVEAGARLRKRVRPYYAVRLENCLKVVGGSAKANSRAANHVGASQRPSRAGKHIAARG